MAERWIEVRNPFGTNMKYLRVRPTGAPADARLRSQPSEGAELLREVETDPYKPLIWMKRFSEEDQAVWFSNWFTGESVWAGTPESKNIVNRLVYILPPPSGGERENFEAWYKANHTPEGISAKASQAEAARAEAARREEEAAQAARAEATRREEEAAMRAKQDRIRKADQERKKQEAEAAQAAVAERERKNAEKEANRGQLANELRGEANALLAIPFENKNGLQAFFGFPMGELTNDSKKKLQSAATKFTRKFHPDKASEILGVEQANELFKRINIHLRGLVFPPDSTKGVLVGTGKKRCTKCGKLKY